MLIYEGLRKVEVLTVHSSFLINTAVILIHKSSKPIADIIQR
jgi:hypothetical protein